MPNLLLALLAVDFVNSGIGAVKLVSSYCPSMLMAFALSLKYASATGSGKSRPGQSAMARRVRRLMGTAASGGR